jgi:hypothetical protein
MKTATFLPLEEDHIGEIVIERREKKEEKKKQRLEEREVYTKQ